MGPIISTDHNENHILKLDDKRLRANNYQFEYW